MVSSIRSWVRVRARTFCFSELITVYLHFEFFFCVMKKPWVKIPTHEKKFKNVYEVFNTDWVSVVTKAYLRPFHSKRRPVPHNDTYIRRDDDEYDTCLVSVYTQLYPVTFLRCRLNKRLKKYWSHQNQVSRLISNVIAAIFLSADPYQRYILPETKKLG